MTSPAEEAHGIPSAGSPPAPPAEERGIPSAELPSAPPPRGLVPCLVYAALSGSVVAGLGNPIVVPVNRTLHVSLEAAQWTLTMSLLMGVVATPIVARLADGRLRRRVLVGALATVAIGSLVGALVPNFPGLMVARALHGLGYALVALTVGIAREHLHGPQLHGTLAVLSTSLAVGAGVANPTVGLMVAIWDYRAGFVFAFLVAAAGAWWTFRTVPEPKAGIAPVHTDILGAALLCSGLGFGLLAITHGVSWGWTSSGVLGLAGGAAVLLLAWVLIEVRLAHPLVDVRLAVAPGILGANLAALLIGCSVFAGAAAGIILTQQTPSGGVGLGHNVAITGLLMGPMALGSLAGPPIARRLVRRLGERSVLPIGTLSCALGFGIFARWHHTELEVLLMMGLMGLGVGITYSILPSLVVARVPMQRTASATGVNQVLRLLGGAVGSAGLAAVLAAHVDGASGLPAESGYVMASLLAAGVSLVAAPLSYWLVPDAPAGASEAGGERTAYLPEEPVTP